MLQKALPFGKIASPYLYFLSFLLCPSGSETEREKQRKRYDLRVFGGVLGGINNRLKLRCS